MQEATQLFKLLSDETRLNILMLLARQRQCVCEISQMLSISQPKASKHLAKLRDLGVVVDTRDEKFIYYQLNPSYPLAPLLTEALRGAAALTQLPQPYRRESL